MAETEETPMIKLKGLTKSFGDLEVLHGIDLDIAQGKVVAIVGPSGSGKSTLLRCLNFLERPDSGTIEIDGLTVDVAKASSADVRGLRTKTAMVFQSFNLFKNLTVIDNVAIGLKDVRKIPKAAALKQAESVLEKVGLTDKYKSYPASLSGGQQQRVAIARALALEPKVLLFDEPTSALDPELAEDVLDCIKEVADGGNTMLLVTHEMSFAYDVADELIFLDEGVIVEASDAKSFFTDPQTERAKQFLGNAMKRFIWAPKPAEASTPGSGI
jgi:L-cystine transport system ATP-binding protein